MRAITFLIACLIGTLGAKAQLWQSVGRGLNDYAEDLYTDTTEGKLYVCGSFTRAGDSTAFEVARWDGSIWDGVGLYPTPSPCTGTCGTAFNIIQYENTTFLCGNFSWQNSVFTNKSEIWRCEGQSWDSCGSPDGPAAFEITNGSLFAIGGYREISGRPATCISTWDGSSWVPFGDSIPFTIFGDVIGCSAYYNGNYYFGGNFDIGNDFHEIIVWNGQQWVSPAAGIFGDAWVNRLTVYHGLLYCGGEFNRQAGNPDDYLMTWNGTSWLPTFPDIQFINQVRELEVIDGVLYIVGQHMAWNGSAWQGPYNLAKFDGYEFCSFGGTDIVPYDIAGLHGELYVTTGYQVGNDVVNYLARWAGGDSTDFCTSIYTRVAEPIENDNWIHISPNPTQTYFELTSTLPPTSQQLVVLDAAGRTQMVVDDYRGKKIDVSMLPAGIYFVQVSALNKTKTLKLLKQ